MMKFCACPLMFVLGQVAPRQDMFWRTLNNQPIASAVMPQVTTHGDGLVERQAKKWNAL
ncbi:hypothetical protein D3C85_1712340 [compost metagenome]